MSSLLETYLLEEGYIKRKSQTTNSEYYIGHNISIRYSDHRGKFTYDLEISRFNNKKNEYSIYTKLSGEPIVVKGIKELRDAIKWYSVYSELFTSWKTPQNTKEIKKTEEKEKIPKKVKKKKKEKQKLELEIMNSKIDPKWTTTFENQYITDPIGFFKSILDGNKHFEKSTIKDAELVHIWASYRNVSGHKISQTLTTQNLRNWFAGNFIKRKMFNSLYDLIVFLNSLFENDIQDKEAISEMFNEYHRPSPKVVSIIDISNQQGLSDQRELVFQKRTGDTAWKTKMQFYVMADIPKYTTFSKDTKEFIWNAILDPRTPSYKIFIETVKSCKDENYRLETFKNHFEELWKNIAST